MVNKAHPIHMYICNSETLAHHISSAVSRKAEKKNLCVISLYWRAFFYFHRVKTAEKTTFANRCGNASRTQKTRLEIQPGDPDFLILSFASMQGLGIADPIGHVDFYGNAGDHQPGCNDSIPAILHNAVKNGAKKGPRTVLSFHVISSWK